MTGDSRVNPGSAEFLNSRDFVILGGRTRLQDNALKPIPPSKAEIRRELDRQVNSYLRKGGEVQEIPRGVSGRDPTDGPLPNAPFVGSGERNPREYLTEVIAEIELRRKPQEPAKRASRRPRKKYIYDDFGEPIRWVWEE